MTRSLFCIILLLFLSLSAISQHNILLRVESLPSYHSSGNDIYLAGSFNGWNPQDAKYKFQKDEKGNYFFDLKLDNGTYEYKITRGGWDKVECWKNGAGIENRILKLSSDTVISLTIEEWADRFLTQPKKSTASKNVHIIDTAFVIPQLKRIRRVWIYLPEGYDKTSGNRYPVLYMHDGQNVFDDATAYAGEWGVDEFLDSTKQKQAIVVAVDHGGDKRLVEYNPYDNDRFGKGEGDRYVDFLVNTLKPFIDKNFRTVKDKEHTFIAGSSMGGLISMYAVIKYPEVFGGAGVFSPAFWVGPKIFDDIKAKGGKTTSAIYFYGGSLEGETMVPDMQKAYEEMKKISKSKLKIVVNENGKHNEPTWRKEFPEFYKWISPQTP